MGRNERRLKRLEERANAASRATRERQKSEREQQIVGWIMEEYDHLEESGEGGDLLKKAVHNVVRDQYEDPPDSPGFYDHDYIAKGWLETMRSWRRVEWIMKAGRERPDVPPKGPPGEDHERSSHERSLQARGTWRRAHSDEDG